MTDIPFMVDLGLILATAAAVGLLARAIGVPLIIGYMLAGLVLGPLTGWVHETDSLELISEVGVALLLFLVGLELSLEKIRVVGKVALLGGVAQLAVTFLLGMGLSLALGLAPLPAALLALGLMFSSTVVVVKLLDRRGELSTTHGRIAVGILLVQDVAVVVALTLLAGLDDPSGAGVDVASIGRGLVSASVGMAALVVAAYLAVRFVLPPLFRWLSTSLESLFVWSLTWCFAFILAAETLGLSVELGAFIAGVSLAQLAYNHELVRRVHPLVNFFLAIFFVTLGVHMEPGAALEQWPVVLAISVFVLIGKPAILMALIPRFGYGERTSFLASLTLGQISEFSFIVATLALAAGLVDEVFISLIGMVGLITMGTSAALIQAGDGIYERLRGTRALALFRADPSVEPEAPTRLENHVIVVGMNSLGRQVVYDLCERGESVLAVDVDDAKLRGLPCQTLQGSTEHPAVLAEAGLTRAKLLVSALRIEDANKLLAYRSRQAGVPSSIHAFDPELADELREDGATHVIVSKYDGIKQVAVALRDAGVIG
jgi:Kef-type K+ transport system membrane component KefB